METHNQFFNHEETVYIDAKVVHGKIVDLSTDKEVVRNLREGSIIRLVIPIADLNEKESHKLIRRKQLFKKGEALEFRIKIKGELREFKARLLEDLFIEQKGNKFEKLSPCKCELTSDFDSERLEADSLNESFAKMSAKYRPDNRSHTCNVFKTFFYKGRRLEDLRTL